MEEVNQKPVSKSHKKRNLILLIIVVILSVFLVSYGQINTVSLPKDLNQTECQEKLSQWCTNCFSENGSPVGPWEIAGTKVGQSLAACSNKYFNIVLTSEQDCTGNTFDYCKTYIAE